MKLLILSLLVCAAMASSCPTYTCDLRWTSHNGRLYKFFTSATTWASAQRHCVNLGGSLASVHNYMEENFVKKVANGNEAWIGLSDAQEYGQWIWSNSNRLDFTNWCPGEPSDWRGAQHCVLVNYSSTKCWDDQECRRLLPYVCMRKIIKPPVAPIVIRRK